MHPPAASAAETLMAAVALPVGRDGSDYSWNHFMAYAGGDGISADYPRRAAFILFSSAS